MVVKYSLSLSTPFSFQKNMARSFWTDVSETWNSLTKKEPTLEEKLQQQRNANYQQQQGIENQLQTIGQKLAQLNQRFLSLPESDPDLPLIFQHIKMHEKQQQELLNQKTLLQLSMENVNKTKLNSDTLTAVHQSNQLVTSILKENKNTIGVAPERIMNNLQAANEKSDHLTNLISTASTTFNANSLEQFTAQRQDATSEMALYKAKLATSASIVKREQLLNSVPTIPIHGNNVQLHLPSQQQPVYPSQTTAFLTTMGGSSQQQRPAEKDTGSAAAAAAASNDIWAQFEKDS